MGVLYRVSAQLNPALRLLGILPVKCDLRTNLARSVKEEVENNFGLERLLPLVRNDIKLAEAPSFGKSIFEYAPGCLTLWITCKWWKLLYQECTKMCIMKNQGRVVVLL